jgi:hypothetical protein
MPVHLLRWYPSTSITRKSAITLRRSSGSESSRGRLDLRAAVVRAVGEIALAAHEQEQLWRY